jgi:hypothetical protein
VDKYQIVTHVWGESYIDEVDDARIEKLISRLRQKIEPDPLHPLFDHDPRARIPSCRWLIAPIVCGITLRICSLSRLPAIL